MSLDSESELVRFAARGDRAALSRLLLLHYDDLHSYVGKLFSRRPCPMWSVEDILQQIFVRAAKSVQNFDPVGENAFRRWLFIIAANLTRDARRAARRRRHVDWVSPDSGPVERDEFVADATSPSMRVHRRDSVRRVHEALAQLPDDQREAVDRYYLRQQSLDEIATAMARTKEAVRGLCFRGRDTLRQLLGHSSWFLSG